LSRSKIERKNAATERELKFKMQIKEKKYNQFQRYCKLSLKITFQRGIPPNKKRKLIKRKRKGNCTAPEDPKYPLHLSNYSQI
jgi:hypothetical protein